MAQEQKNPGPAGQQPEATRSLEAAARAGSEKPEAQGLTARADTAPSPDSLEREQEVAARVLREGAEKPKP
jgi:hypothetical protein